MLHIKFFRKFILQIEHFLVELVQMNELMIEGKKFYSSRRTGDILGYTNDYVSKLCRNGKLNARMIGRSWYISEDSIQNYKESIICEKDLRKKGLSKTMSSEYHSRQVDPSISTEEHLSSLSSIESTLKASTQAKSNSHPLVISLLLKPLSSKVVTGVYFVTSIFVTGVILLQIPETSNLGGKIINSTKDEVAVSVAKINFSLGLGKNISGQMLASVQGSRKISNDVSVKDNFDYFLKNFNDLGQIGRGGLLKIGNSFLESNNYYLAVGDFYINVTKNVLSEFVRPIRVATEYYLPLFESVALGYKNIGNATLNIPVVAFEATKRIGNFYIASTDSVLALNKRSIEDGVQFIGKTSVITFNKISEQKSSFSLGVNNSKDQVASVSESQKEISETDVKTLNQKYKSSSKKPNRSSEIGSISLKDGMITAGQIYIGIVGDAVGIYRSIGNEVIRGSGLVFDSVKGVGDFYINSTAGSFGAVARKLEGTKDSFKSSSPEIRNTASAYLSLSGISDNVFKKGEYVTNVLSGIGNKTLSII